MKRIICLLACVILTLSVVGCGNKNTVSNTSKESSPQKGEEKSTDKNGSPDQVLEHMAISIGHWNASEMLSDKENDEVLKLLEEKFNVTFEARSVSWSDFEEKYKLWAASGELPDVFATAAINTQTYETWVGQGIVKELPTDLSAYPNIAKIFDMQDVKPLQRDGKYFMIPRLTYPTNEMWALDRGLLVRKDWLEKLGLEVPKTYEEVKVALRKMVDSDIDGNKIKDTVGLTMKATSNLEAFLLGCVPQVTNGSWIKEDGQWIPAYMSKNMMTGILQLRELYKDGLLDNDFAIMKPEDGLEKFAQGNVAMVATQVLPVHLYDIEKRWKKYDNALKFEDAVAIVPFWSHEDGNTYTFTQTTYWSESYFNADIGDKKMERILQIYDYLASDQFKEIKTYGIKGVDFKKDDDKYTILLEKDEDGKYVNLEEKYPSLKVFYRLVAWGQESMLIKNEINYTKFGKGLVDMSVDFYDYTVKNMTPTPNNYEVKLMTTPAKTAISIIKFFDEVTKVIITDRDPNKEWEKVVDGYNAKGVPKAIKEVNEKVKELGIE